MNRSDQDSGVSSSTSFSLSSPDADSFAASIVDRIAAATASNAGDTLSGSAEDLKKALADAITYVRDNFGDAAAKTVMGLVEKGVGDGQGGENAMGDAMVSALRFIDSSFGIAAGDKAMAYFNGSLNSAINDYFQNGLDETFYATDGSTDSTGQVAAVVSQTLADVTERFGEDMAKTIGDIIEDSLSRTGAPRQGLSQALSAASQALDQSNPGQAADLTATTLPASLAKGSVLELTV
jgi:hypothetical protein